ncbi:hypothetical protein CBS115989_4183 [Aspergillus niger]|nr:hypothetical protein CBS115989_4183 [Aspergillus niger]KAI2839393.1 hypothetical protein CBS11232_9383 [Aspergillus niger]KAI2841751.1 hypothetical protein CBS11350_6296 [Aspergillus niger]KAI2863886.1 hypothetical protein CBS12448_3406 [Aspergillus niger]KAI2880632.1 hypothetical protein CBS115988_1384 [Aspergillus niger]
MAPSGLDGWRLPAYEPLNNELEPHETEQAMSSSAVIREETGELDDHEETMPGNISQSSNSSSRDEASCSGSTSDTAIMRGSAEDKPPESNVSAPEPKDASDRFTFELAGVVVSAGLLATMLALLSVYDHQPQPSWPHISLNAVISTLSTLSKASLIFSVALAFDPFSQNLIHNYVKMVADPSGKARIGTVSIYNTIGSDMATSFFEVDPALKGNVYNSLFNNDQSRPWEIPKFVCTSSNCTWDEPVASLEFRTLCTNVTSVLIPNCTTFPANSSYAGQTNCTFTLPKSNTSAWYLPNSPVMTPFSVAGVPPTDAEVYTNASLIVIQYIAPQHANVSLFEGGLLPNGTLWEATECLLDPIVRSFRPAVHQNTYSEETLAIWTQSNFVTVDNANVTAGNTLTPPGTWVADYGVPVNQSSPQNNSAQSYVLGFNAGKTIETFFQAIFSGQSSRSVLHTVFTPTFNNYAASDTLEALGWGNITGCSDLLADRLPCAMGNVAAAMTKTLRDSAYIADPRSTSGWAVGNAMMPAVYIAVHWQWVVLPLVVWVAGATLVGGTLWKTQRARAPAWRNDTLPLLFLYKSEERLLRPDGRLAGPGRELCMARLYENEGRVFLGQ